MGRRREDKQSAKLGHKWAIALFIGVLLLAFKLVTDKAMVHVNTIHNAMNISTLEISVPQISVKRKAMVLKSKGIWAIPYYLLPHPIRTVFIEHQFRGFDYNGVVTFNDELGSDQTFHVTKKGRETYLAFDKLFYRGVPNTLAIDPGTATFQDGRLNKVESPLVILTTDDKVFVGENMVMTVGIDPHEVTIVFSRTTFEKQTIDNLTLNLNTNIFISRVKKLELTHVEGKGVIKDTAFDFMWSESKDDNNQLKLSGYGTIPLVAFESIITPIKKGLLQTERKKIFTTQNKMKLLQFDLLKNLHLQNFEKQFISRFIPEGHYRKDKTFFHFDIRPEAPITATSLPKTAQAYFKMARFEPQKTVYYLRNSCGLGFAEACFQLGILSERSKKEKNSSRPFFELGCKLKHKESCRKAKFLSINN